MYFEIEPFDMHISKMSYWRALAPPSRNLFKWLKWLIYLGTAFILFLDKACTADEHNASMYILNMYRPIYLGRMIN